MAQEPQEPLGPQVDQEMTAQERLVLLGDLGPMAQGRLVLLGDLGTMAQEPQEPLVLLGNLGTTAQEPQEPQATQARQVRLVQQAPQYRVR